MTCKSLMAHLELSGDNEGVLNIAAELAGRFGARVIGIAACQPLPILYGEGLSTGEILTQDRQEIARELAAVEKQFRDRLDGLVQDLQWRSTVTYAPLADFLAEEARAADLVITGKDLGAHLFDDTRRVHMGDLIMRAGRPILLVPRGVRALPIRRAVIGWKETRESRRAVADALPLLREAGQVTVLAIVPEAQLGVTRDQVADLVDWLALHGVRAMPQVEGAKGSETLAIANAVREHKCDLLVAGGYGHTRLGEWVFGGVTQDLLLDPDSCVLISH